MIQLTYLQLMMKCLNFFKDQNEKFSDNFYIHWFANDEEGIDLEHKSDVKKAIMYLILLEIRNNNDDNNPLLDILERDLSFYDVSLCKTLGKAEEKAIQSIKEDPYKLDQVCLLETGDLTDEEQKEIIKDLFEEFKNQMPDNWEIEQYESAIHNVMEMVSQIIPELFFTERGYKYIDEEYQIDDLEFRGICYEYLKDNIEYYNSNRIYKVDENIYNELYEEDIDEEDIEEEDFDEYDDEDIDEYEEEDFEDEFYYDEDDIRGQVDIYGEDIDNYDILYYSVTLLVVMLRFIKNKQYDKIKRMIEIDDVMTNSYEGHGFNYDKTLIEALYQPKTIDKDYHRKISTPKQSDSCLEFFLSNNDFIQRYDIQQLSLIIAHCFDLLDEEPINRMIKNIDMIDNVFYSTDLNNQEENIKRLVKIKKS